MLKRYSIFANLALLFLFLASSCTNTENNQTPISSPQASQSALTMLNRLPSSTPFQAQSSNTPSVLATSAISLEPTSNEPLSTPEAPQNIPSNGLPECTNQAEFIRNLNVGDNTAFNPGQYFAKIWQIKNIGTCTWTKEYNLIFISGNNMNSPTSIGFKETILPGETIDLRLDLVAPNIEGTHDGKWMLQDNLGNLFGIGESNSQPLEVVIIVKPTPAPTSGCVQCQVHDDDDP